MQLWSGIKANFPLSVKMFLNGGLLLLNKKNK